MLVHDLARFGVKVLHVRREGILLFLHIVSGPFLVFEQNIDTVSYNQDASRLRFFAHVFGQIVIELYEFTLLFFRAILNEFLAGILKIFSSEAHFASFADHRRFDLLFGFTVAQSANSAVTK